MPLRTGTPLLEWYRSLFEALGPQGWWPGRTRFEVIVGAILTQSVAWSNVEKAIRNLRRERLLDPEAMRRAGPARIARLIRPAGYFNQKAHKLQVFVDVLHREHGGSLDAMLRVPATELRQRLLAIPGIGRETADSILLYAGRKPVFVIDAYTRRVLRRHGAIEGKEPYDDLREGFETSLPRRVDLFNEYHALIVRL